MYRGTTAETRGTAFVIYEDIFDAKNACDHLSGFNVCNRYLVVLYYQPAKVSCRTVKTLLGIAFLLVFIYFIQRIITNLTDFQYIFNFRSFSLIKLILFKISFDFKNLVFEKILCT